MACELTNKHVEGFDELHLHHFLLLLVVQNISGAVWELLTLSLANEAWELNHVTTIVCTVQ